MTASNKFSRKHTHSYLRNATKQGIHIETEMRRPYIPIQENGKELLCLPLRSLSLSMCLSLSLSPSIYIHVYIYIYIHIHVYIICGRWLFVRSWAKLPAVPWFKTCLPGRWPDNLHVPARVQMCLTSLP